MIDFHSHILPAFDDGAVTVDESIVIANALADFGYKKVCCTPHCIKGYYDLTPQKVREATLMLQADLDNAEIHLELLPGMEYMLDEHFAEFAEDLLPLGETRLVLCEAPQQTHPELAREGLQRIIDKGYTPLIAHPERTEFFFEMLTVRGSQDDEKGGERDAARGTRFEENPQESRSFLKKFWPFSSRVARPAVRNVSIHDTSLPDACLFQANLGSFTGYYGEAVQRRAYQLLKQGAYSALASDLHDGASASKILVPGKIETNPFLKKLSEWDGTVDKVGAAEKSGAGQGELF